MLKQVFILTILIVGLITTSSVAQKSAQASMKVSVEVVEGASVTMSQPDKVNLSESANSDFGAMLLQGSENTLVKVSDKLQLFNSNGNQINFDITAINDVEPKADNIRFRGLKSQNSTEKGSYSGEMKATVEYL
jgi:hypothetical protein